MFMPMPGIADRLNPVEAAGNLFAYRSSLRHEEHEQKDLCSLGDILLPRHLTLADASPLSESAQFNAATLAPVGSRIIGGGKVLKDVRGMGRVYDWRGTLWSPPNGGKIRPLVFVQHIPVVPNMAGIADFVRLRDVLVAQGLMVQNATDRTGNIALYTHMDRLCYQARGANQQSCGTEHMHMTLSETWTRRQLRASAWLINQALNKYNIPSYGGTLNPGPGVARVKRRGQVTHQAVSNAAGYHDRTDPGSLYDNEYVRHCVAFYRQHEHFEGA